ncbi:unnamed protein product [Choristocarpus tenellus]
MGASQYLAPVLTVGLATALLVHSSGDGDSLGEGGLGVCRSLRWAFRAPPLEVLSGVTAFEGTSSGNGLESKTPGDGGQEVVGLSSFGFAIPPIPEEAWEGILGFLVWWACLSWAVTHACSVAYWRRFPGEEAMTSKGKTERTMKGKKDSEVGVGGRKAKGRRANKL